MSKWLIFYLIGWLAVISTILIFPVVYGYNCSTPEKKFLGVTGIYPTEQFYYLSVGAAQGFKNTWTFSDKYGRVPEKEIFLNPIGNFIALIQKITGTSLPVSFNIFRIISCMVLILSFYHLARQFIPPSFSLLATVILYSVCGGFDFLFKILHIWQFDPLDDSFPEINMFLSMNGEYYIPMANALFILTMSFGYRLIYKREKVIVTTGVLLFLLGAVYVYGMVAAVIVLACISTFYGLFEKNMLARTITLIKVFLCGVPIVLYYVWLLYQFPAISDKGWSESPRFFSILLSFGFVFVLAIPMAFKNKLSVAKGVTFLCVWAITSLILIQIPTSIIPFKLQMVIGLGAPLCVLSGMFLNYLGEYLIQISGITKSSIRSMVYFFVFGIIISLSSLTNFNFYFNQLEKIKNQQFPYFIGTNVSNAIDWCAKNVDEHKLVVVPRKLAFIFSGSTACWVYAGIARDREKTTEQINTIESLNLMRENKIEEAKQILRKTEADYLFLDKSFSDADFQSLREILKTIYPECFSNSEISIFQLK